MSRVFRHRLVALGVALEVALGVALALACMLLRAQTPVPAAGRYTLAGTVVNAQSGQPLAGATVAILSAQDSLTLASVVSDVQGGFAFTGLAAGKYQLTGSKRGYTTGFYDQHGNYNSAVVTGEGQDTDHLTLRLAPEAVLRGTITGDGGDPVQGASVLLFERSKDASAGRHIQPVGATETDDAGTYEFAGLEPGQYLLAVKAQPWYAMSRMGPGAPIHSSDGNGGSLDVAYPITYYDSTTDEASATPIALAAGVVQQADVTLHAVPALHLTVQVPPRANGGAALPMLRQSIFGESLGDTEMNFTTQRQPGQVQFSSLAPGH